MISQSDSAQQAIPVGEEILHNPSLNKGTAFSLAEREKLGLRGLLPPGVQTIEQQEQRVLENFRRKTTPIQKYIYMAALQDRNETLFYHVVINHLEEMVPILYTPTVGQACQEFGHIYRRARGMFISLEDRGYVAEILDNWRHDVRVIVMTDGERILGLGDLGANGMGIPIGKLSLYTACAGIDPTTTLPITIDVGTNNEDLLHDPLYLGQKHPRVQGEAYDALIEEVFDAVQEKWPQALIQFEDFGNRNAFRLLANYRHKARTFNDDIQGTASVTLAGLYSAAVLSGIPLKDQKLLFLGAGEAGTGIGELVVSALMEEGLSESEARLRCWFVDSRGLVVNTRDNLADHKLPFAHTGEYVSTLLEAVQALKPTAIVGVSGRRGMFTQDVVEAMTAINERPIVFALSNPTKNSECTAIEAYRWSDGRAIFASGSPFDRVEYGGQTFVPGQANNAYIFPGVGLGVSFSGASQVTDEMFAVAARTLANLVSENDLSIGRIFPALADIRRISLKIGTSVAQLAYARGLATAEAPVDIETAMAEFMYQPIYQDFD
jgi:malate dehydrogenase (oxaloacetate-decarboxylating)(NADP+)